MAAVARPPCGRTITYLVWSGASGRPRLSRPIRPAPSLTSIGLSGWPGGGGGPLGRGRGAGPPRLRPPRGRPAVERVVGRRLVRLAGLERRPRLLDRRPPAGQLRVGRRAPAEPQRQPALRVLPHLHLAPRQRQRLVLH